MTMFDKDISRSTRVIQIIGGFFVLAVLSGTITFLGIGWNNSAKDARDSQADYRSQVTKTETLQTEYNKLYREFQKATGEKPKAASPESVKQVVGQPGATGAKGDMGVQGQSGPQGIKGDAGTPGATGATGAAGSTGATGASGEKGSTGSTGATGAQGPQGEPGPAGPQGPQGPPGPAGDPGPAGTPGPGRGISSIDCDGAGPTSTWLINYTDGTSQQIAGPCRAILG